MGSIPPSILKLAALKPEVELQPHQKRIADEAAQHQIRKLLYWQLGSGKSLGAIGAAEAYGKPYTAVVPASLRENMKKEINKFTDNTTPADVVSYTGVSSGKPVQNLGTLIFDEAARLRNPKSLQTRKSVALSDQAEQLLLLTGTPITNRPEDLAVPLRMITGRKMTPEEFSGRYVGKEQVDPGWYARLHGVKPGEKTVVKNKDELKALLDGHVDYYSPDKPPVNVTTEDVEALMSKEQHQLYRAMWGDLPWTLRWKLSNDFPLTENEMQWTLKFLNGPRQIGLSTLPYMKEKDPIKAFEQSGKLQEAMRRLQTRFESSPESKALVFSNFIDAGLTPYHAALQKANIPAAVFHGGLNDKQRKQLVDDYNSGKLRVALLGPSGAEGLSFKGTQLIQILDPHWNSTRTRQQEGRGVRHDSHWGLPEDLQNVHIERYAARTPPGFLQRAMLWDPAKPGPAADDYLAQLSRRKDEANEQFLALLRELGTRRHSGR